MGPTDWRSVARLRRVGSTRGSAPCADAVVCYAARPPAAQRSAAHRLRRLDRRGVGARREVVVVHADAECHTAAAGDRARVRWRHAATYIGYTRSHAESYPVRHGPQPGFAANLSHTMMSHPSSSRSGMVPSVRTTARFLAKARAASKVVDRRRRTGGYLTRHGIAHCVAATVDRTLRRSDSRGPVRCAKGARVDRVLRHF